MTPMTVQMPVQAAPKLVMSATNNEATSLNKVGFGDNQVNEFSNIPE